MTSSDIFPLTKRFEESSPPTAAEIVTSTSPQTAPKAAALTSTSWTHVVCGNGWTIPDPVMGFYTRVPDSAPCKWSTDQGRNRKRSVQHPLPERPFGHWGDDRVHELAAHFRQKYPQDMAGLKRPVLFEDLYEYFDGRDLFFQGAWNMWNLINVLYDENILLAPELLDALREETDAWVREWASFVPNRRRLMDWDRGLDVLTVLWPLDWSESGISTLDESKLSILRTSLVNYYRCLTGYNHVGSFPPDQNRDPQNDQAVAIWLKGQQYHSEGFTPPYNTITMQHYPNIPAEGASTVQQKPTHPNRPVIVNGSKSVVPKIRRSDDTSPLANKGKNAKKDSDTLRAVSSKGGSPDSEETWKSDSYYKPGRSSKQQDDAKSHQSSISDPSKALEPFPKLADSLPYPFNSVAAYDSTIGKQSGGANSVQKQTSSVVAGSQRPHTAVPIQQAPATTQMPPFTNGSQGPNFSGYPPPLSQPPAMSSISSQAPTVYKPQLLQTQPLHQIPVTNGPMLGVMQPVQPYGSGPSDPMASRGPQQVLSQQVPPQQVTPYQAPLQQAQPQQLLPQGVNPYHVQTAQASVPQAIPQMMYPQMAMPRHMASMPMQPSNPHVANQSQNDTTQNRRYSNQYKSRNSPQNNGWQTKIRDDPIHGAVYVHNRSQRNGSMAGAGDRGPQQQGGGNDSTSRPACKNGSWKYGDTPKFAPCDCARCVCSSHCIFIRDLKDGLPQNMETLNHFKRFFGKFGQIEDLTWRTGAANRPHAYLRFAHYQQAQGAIASLQGPRRMSIAGLGDNVFVGFPYYSMYFTKVPKYKNRRESISESTSATPKAIQSFPSQQLVRQQVHLHRNGLRMDQTESRMPPYPGYGHPGGTVVHHPLPGRPTVLLHPDFAQHHDPRNSIGPHVPGQIPSQQTVFELSHRPTPESLQREIDSLDRRKKRGYRKPPSENTAERMDISNTPSSSASTVVDQPAARPPITPPDQRDSSSSSSGDAPQSSKDMRAETHPASLEQFRSSVSVEAGQLSESTSENTEDLDSGSDLVVPPECTVEGNEEVTEAAVGQWITPPEQPLSGSDCRVREEGARGVCRRSESLHSMDDCALEKDTADESRESQGAMEVKNDAGYSIDDETEAQISDQTQDSPGEVESEPKQTHQVQDKKVKNKKNKAKTKKLDSSSASAASTPARQNDSQRPSSSASQGSSACEGRKKQKKKWSHQKNKKKQQALPSDAPQAPGAAQPGWVAVPEDMELKTEEYKEKIQSLFSPSTDANDLSPTTSLSKDPEAPVENRRKGYRANAGGSLKMQKNRPPALSQNTFKRPEGSETAQLSSIAEAVPKQIVEKEKSPTKISPTAHEFTNQKFEIDQMKSKGQPSSEVLTDTAAPKTQIQLGSLPPGFDPYPRPAPLSRVSPRDDVFSPKKEDKKPKKAWIHAESVKKTAPTANTKEFITPSPSPRKATVATPSSTKSNLNPSAKPFTIPAPSQSATPTSTMLTASTKHGRQSSHISTHSSAPSTSSRVSSDRRYFTPLEQTPKAVTTPPSPKKGKQPTRRFGKGASQNEGTSTVKNNTRKKNVPRLSPLQDQQKKRGKPAEPAAPKLSVDNFPELPAAKKPMVEAKAPKLVFPSSTWNKPKGSGSSSSQDSSKPNSPRSEEKTPPKKAETKTNSPGEKEKGEVSPAEWLLQKHRKESMSAQNV